MDFQSTLGVGGPGHHVHRIYIQAIFLWGYLKDLMYSNNLQTVQELQAETEAIAEEITHNMLHDTGDNLCFFYKSTRSKNVILNMFTT
jgi:hypothetical protein